MRGLAGGVKTMTGSDTKCWTASIDSVMIQADNVLVLSSASASMSPSSFQSDSQGHDSPVSEFSKHLAGSDSRDAPSRAAASHLGLQNRHSLQSGTPKGSSQMQEGKGCRRVLEDDPPNCSFSDAIKECQRRRLPDGRNRTASLDLNCSADAYDGSPALDGSIMVMGKSGGIYASPVTPHHRPGFAQPKGWSSERVPLPSASTRRYGSVFSYPGKSQLPSKWEDAEKWIFSPLSVDAAPSTRPSVPPRRPKSKSGPLALVSSASSPAIAGRFLLPQLPMPQFSEEEDAGNARSSNVEPCVGRSVSVHGWSADLVIQAPESPDSVQESQPENTPDGGTCSLSPPAIFRRDMGTQMSSGGSSTLSSPGRRDSLSSPSPLVMEAPVLSIMELQQIGHFPKLEIRDVEVDDGIAVPRRRSKKFVEKISFDVGAGWQKKAVDARASAWEVEETAKCVSRFKREEAKINAWENLQKAKAEAEIRKLEMKLEKMRSSSMEKILNKLRSSQRKAQNMRITASATQAATSFRRAGHMSSLGGCFTCHAS